MLRTVVAVFKSPVQTKEAVEEIQGESLANSKISVLVRHEYVRQRNVNEEIASELAYYPVEKNLDAFNAWLVQAPPLNIPDLGDVLAAGPLANVLMRLPKGAGLADALLGYGLTGERSRHYEHEVRTGQYLVLIQTEHEKVNSVANTLQCYGGKDIEKWNKELDHPLYPFH
ncbi:MAG: hypothetical protein QMC95_10305 [Desulfitobacteriaceae bacterium]|nr:hypothetical protein [Desulfitobacteriaceae bacterium]MDI6878846.1 hypothetical protein [Desulfitobacteriaceae bacterium]MDI6914601.1 hypothetical protein [Desulfitobacteriaceae bacterium]